MTDAEPTTITHALTLIQPWAYAIERLGKRVENRGWAPPQWAIGKRIYIHAGAKLDRDSWWSLAGTGRDLPTTMDQRSIGCSVEITGWVGADGRRSSSLTEHEARLALESEWYVPGNVAWVLRDVRLIEPRIPAKGQLGLWEVRMTDAELDAIEARANRASTGPWASVLSGDGVSIEDADDQVVARDLATEADGFFVIHARADVPSLVSELRAARERLKAAEALSARWRHEDFAKFEAPAVGAYVNQCADELEATLRGGK